ncbi:MAG: hypothetical protein DMF66_01120 [Acidobacteria bacterium]|nr:MAG: hypothetical protein DMF66_01120 [Acidobacteriota bacterium]
MLDNALRVRERWQRDRQRHARSSTILAKQRAKPLQPVRLQTNSLGTFRKFSRETEAREFRDLQDFRYRRRREYL